MRDDGKSVWLDFRHNVRPKAHLYRTSREVVSFGLRAWPISKHSPLSEPLMNLLLKYNEGHLDYFPQEKHDNWPDRFLAKVDKSKITETERPIEITQIWGIFVTWALGVILSFIVFMFSESLLYSTSIA